MLIESLCKNNVVFIRHYIASVTISIVVRTIFYAHYHIYALRDLTLFYLRLRILDDLRVTVVLNALFRAF